MKQWKWLAGPVVLALGMAGMASAQDGADGGNGGANGGNGAAPGQRGERGRRGGDRPDFRNMTPEEREQAMAQMREQGLRRSLQGSGITDAAVQDAVIAFAVEQDRARRPLRDLSRKVSEALRSDAVTDAQMSILLEDFRTEVAQERTRSQAAAKVLEAKISFSKKPKLDALLTMMGLVGDEASLAGGLGGPGGRGRGGPGGPGGGFGGFGGPPPAGA